MSTSPSAERPTEPYRLYTRFRSRFAVASVEHEPWPLRRATRASLEETVRSASDLPGEAVPALVHYSAGVRGVGLSTHRRWKTCVQQGP
jgi:uncharacterized protein YqjF (DUF2071 family)